MKLIIKYMFSIRCKNIVKSELDKLGLHYKKIDLGEVEIKEDLTDEQRHRLKLALIKSGLELMDDKKAVIIENIKHVIAEVIHYSEELPKITASEFISEKLKFDFKYLSSLFSETTGTTIEHYIITHKIERVKELLLYYDLSLTEIARRLNYSDTSHLSHQFKKITGLTPTFFMHLKHKKCYTIKNV